MGNIPEECDPISYPISEWGVFEQNGTIHSKDKHHILLDYQEVKLLLPIQNFYVDGCKQCSATELEFLSKGHSIKFDAFPTKGKHKCGDATAIVTCGWIGDVPNFTQRFPFCFGLDEIPKSVNVKPFKSGWSVMALIVLLPDPNIAVCKIECGSSCLLSKLHKAWLCKEDCCSRFKDTLENVLSVGDIVAIRSNSANLSYFWFHIVKCKKILTAEKSNWPNCKFISQSTREEFTFSLENSIEKSYHNADFDDWIYSEDGELGLFSHLETSEEGILLYKDVKVTFHLKNCFFRKLQWKALTKGNLQNLYLKFEAIKKPASCHSSQYDALCVWDKDKPNLRERMALLTVHHYIPSSTGLIVLQGTVVTYALPRVAFVSYVEDHKNLVALVYSSTLAKSDSFAPIVQGSFIISSVLKIGDILELKALYNRDTRVLTAVSVCPVMRTASLKNSVSIKSQFELSQKLPIPKSYIRLSRRLPVAFPPPISRLQKDFLPETVPEDNDHYAFMIKSNVSQECAPYNDNVGMLVAVLSDDEAVFIVKSYAVYIKIYNVFSDGVQCEKWNDIIWKEFNILSCRMMDVPSKALCYGVSQEGICAVSVNCRTLNICKSKIAVPLDEHQYYSGKVKQYLSFDTALVDCEVNNQTCVVLLWIHVVSNVGANKMNSKKKFIGCFLAIGDEVSMKICADTHKDGYFSYRASHAVKGCVGDTVCSGLNVNKVDELDGVPYISKGDGTSPVTSVVGCSRSLKQSRMSSCFSLLMQMSGIVVYLFNDFQGIIQVDVLKLEVEFGLKDMVFWEHQDDERDKTLSDLTPINTVLLFNAKKETQSGKIIFRATQVWKPSCVPDS